MARFCVLWRDFATLGGLVATTISLFWRQRLTGKGLAVIFVSSPARHCLCWGVFFDNLVVTS